MIHLFLTSSANFVAKDIAKKIDCNEKKLAFISTAAEVEKGSLTWLKNDRDSLVDIGFDVKEYTFTNKNREEVKNDLEKFDVLFFSGGNTFYLLQQIQKSGSASVIKNFINKGKIFIGSSAGSLIAGPDILPVKFTDDPKLAPNLKSYKALNLVDFLPVPHWGMDDFKKAYLDEMVNYIYNTDHKIILLTNYQYIEVLGDRYKIEDTKI